MKRFVTYLYECERGNKSKNVGFIRVNVRGVNTTMEVYLRNVVRAKDVGKLYVLIYKEELQGIELGNLEIQNGQSDGKMEVSSENIKDSGFSLADIEGVGICFESGMYIASCWKDTYANEIILGDFKIEEELTEDVVLRPMMNSEPECLEIKNEVDEKIENERRITYEKIDLSQIRDLPSPNWHLATNSFLVHGFWNYGYLVLKENVEENQKTLSLGVPGVFEKPEAVMAIYFGFPSFEEIPEEMVNAELNQRMSISRIKENQETKTGAFGCWFVRLKI